MAEWIWSQWKETTKKNTIKRSVIHQRIQDRWWISFIDQNKSGLREIVVDIQFQTKPTKKHRRRLKQKFCVKRAIFTKFDFTWFYRFISVDLLKFGGEFCHVRNSVKFLIVVISLNLVDKMHKNSIPEWSGGITHFEIEMKSRRKPQSIDHLALAAHTSI